MQPYWRSGDGRLTIYHGRAEDVLPSFAAESADLLLTDPPYGAEWESNRRGESFGAIANDHNGFDPVPYLRAALRCLRGRRHFYAFGRWDCSSLPLGGVCELIWDKVGMGAGDLTLPWGKSHEYITFGVYANAAQRRGGTGNGPARMRRGTVLRYQRPSGVSVTRHPTEKPVGLLRELIESSSRIGETVLDPFMGSGSTGEAAQREDRRFIGIEIEERYCEIAAKRLEDPPLFRGVAS
jgi:hypothetical protein